MPVKEVRYPHVDEVAAFLRRAPEDMPWSHEAIARHTIRVGLILQGRAWRKADLVAEITVERARRKAGVRQPVGWDHVLHPWDFSGRAGQCPICDRWFRSRFEGHSFCCTRCNGRATEIRQREGLKLEFLDRPCVACGAMFEPRNAKALYCSRRCMQRSWERAHQEAANERSKRWRRKRRPPKFCLWCDQQIPEHRLAAAPRARCCSDSCQEELRRWTAKQCHARYEAKKKAAREAAKLNGSANGAVDANGQCATHFVTQQGSAIQEMQAFAATDTLASAVQ